MITVNVRKLLNGTVSLRDYTVQKCIERNIPLKVIYGDQYMILSPTELETKKRQLTRRLFKSKCGGQNYSLYDYEFNPVNEN